jgi:uncharacterized protein
MNVPIEWQSLAVAALMTFIASAVRGLTGFGMAIILVPLLGMIIPPAQAVILAILLQVMIGPVEIRKSLTHCERPSTFIIAGAAVLATPVGLWLLTLSTPDTARLIIAGIAIAAFVLVIIPKSPHGRPGLPLTVGTGITAGLLTGFAAMPGPPVVPYYLQGSVTPQTARASMMTIFFATAIAGTLASFASGMASGGVIMMAAILLGPMLLGNYLGSKAFGRISPLVWRSCVAVLLGMAGMSALWRAIH